MHIRNEKEMVKIRLDPEEAKKLCQPGRGEYTCIWLLVGVHGFECTYYCRPTALETRWLNGETDAQRDGCEVVKKLGYKIKYEPVRTLAEILEENKRASHGPDSQPGSAAGRAFWG